MHGEVSFLPISNSLAENVLVIHRQQNKAHVLRIKQKYNFLNNKHQFCTVLVTHCCFINSYTKMNIFTEKTLVANWFEDRILQEDKIKEYLDKRERGELQSQKNASLSTAMLNSTKLSASTDGWVKIGDNVSFVNPHLFYDKTLALTFAGETATALDFTSPQVGIFPIHKSH